MKRVITTGLYVILMLALVAWGRPVVGVDPASTAHEYAACCHSIDRPMEGCCGCCSKPENDPCACTSPGSASYGRLSSDPVVIVPDSILLGTLCPAELQPSERSEAPPTPPPIGPLA